ncbi:MAG TPA: hypothetical protein VED40_02525 [Azospirillaceae bacterium]|nr:hypothetical protein [Azospirillaceae bacterium]
MRTGRRDLIIGGGLGALAAGTVSAAPTAPAPADQATLTAPGARLEMAIRFTRGGVERGRERATCTVNANGTLTLSARSESRDPRVVRDTTYLLAPDHRPLAAFVLMTNDGRPDWWAQYRFTDGAVEMEGWGVDGRRGAGRFPLQRPVAAFVTHAVATDMFVARAADRARPGEVVRTLVHLSSADPYGRTGPEFVAREVGVRITDGGLVATPLGPLRADHVELHLPDATGSLQPFQDMWCLAGTPIFLRSRARPPYDTLYELTALEFFPPGA